MSQTILTPTQVTRKSLEIAHNKLTFIGTVNRQFDDQFGVEGGKIGSTLRIRLPNQYTVRTGQQAAVQATVESSVTLTVATQKGVDLDFSSAELGLSLDDFSERILEPAMAVLSAAVEADALSMVLQVPNFTYQTDFITDPSTMATWLTARSILSKNLVPKDGKLSAQVTSEVGAATVSGQSALFHEGKSLASQYLDGVMGHAFGFDFYENEMVPVQTNGTATSFATGQVGAASQIGSSIAVQNFTNADVVTAGSIVTFPGCYQVHPETKAAYPNLMQFVLTAGTTFSGTTGNLTISPAIVTSGATQNVSASPTAGATIVIMGASASSHPQNVVYHKDAFTFVTTNMIMPKNMDMAAREVYDGVALRFLRGFDILNDVFISRLDILYGYLAMRPAWACRVNSK